jgi:CarboxypepD_reg-like domain
MSRLRQPSAADNVKAQRNPHILWGQMRTILRGASVFAALLVTSSIPASAQTGTLTGTVTRDSAGNSIAGAEVMLPDLKRNAVANYMGEFRLSQLPVGRHEIVVRHAGFAALVDTIEITDGGRVDREFLLREIPTKLDEVRISAPQRKFISPALTDFEERRKSGQGKFISEDELRKNDDHPLLNTLTTHISGVMRMPVDRRQNVEYLATGRQCGPGSALLSCKGGVTYCPVTLFLDGVMIYDASRGEAPPDMRDFDPKHIAAVEFYSAATVPAKYNQTSSGCGVLILWTRER